MDLKNQQDVYSALLGTADITSQATKEILEKLEKIKGMLSDVLSHAYADNNELKAKQQKAALLHPELAKELGVDLGTIGKKMENIHKEVTATNHEMMHLQAKVNFLKEQSNTASPALQQAIAKELSTELHNLGNMNAKYTEGLKALKTNVLALGEQVLAANITNPADVQAINNTLEKVYEKANDLKLQATSKNTVLKEVANKVDETSQKRFGK